jgi:hypothetical protein
VKKWCVLPFLALLLFCSCIGVSADITLRSDGSGKLALEYRVSRMAQSLGRMDGNEMWPTVPVGRADFERSLSRLPGMKIVSFAASEAPSPAGENMGKDLVTRVVLEFADTETLLAFLDPTGKHSSLSQKDGKNSLSLTLLDKPSSPLDSDILELLHNVSSGYEIKLSLDAGKGSREKAGILLSDGNGNPINAGDALMRGDTVSFSMKTADMLSMESGVCLDFEW